MTRKKSVAAVLAEIEHRINSSDLLTDEEKASARERAREHVLKLRKEKAIDAYFAAAVKEEERGYEPNDQMVDFEVDLPVFTPYIAIDGVCYYHGITYELSTSRAVSIRDIQYRAWQHDWEIHGRRRTGDAVRDPLNKGINQQRNVSMSMTTGAISTTQNMRQPRL